MNYREVQQLRKLAYEDLEGSGMVGVPDYLSYQDARKQLPDAPGFQQQKVAPNKAKQDFRSVVRTVAKASPVYRFAEGYSRLNRVGTRLGEWLGNKLYYPESKYKYAESYPWDGLKTAPAMITPWRTK